MYYSINKLKKFIYFLLTKTNIMLDLLLFKLKFNYLSVNHIDKHKKLKNYRHNL